MHYDTFYPWIQTPEMLRQNQNPIVAHSFRTQLQKHCPEWFKWRWLQGAHMNAGEGNQGDFQNPFWWWVNQKYDVGTGRLVESIEASWCENYVDLEGGYRMLMSVGDPMRMLRDPKYNMLVLQFLYNTSTGKLAFASSDKTGAQRLRQFIQHLEKMPNNPINAVVFQPMGEELLEMYSPHLKQLEYKPTGHTTNDLIKVYKYWLKAKPTKWIEEPESELPLQWWRAKYQPVDLVVKNEECSHPDVFENGEEIEVNYNYQCSRIYKVVAQAM